MYIEDTALPAMVHTKATRPDLFVVAANVVNQPLISWIHWNLGVVKPYLPELNGTPASHDGPVDWRASRLPSWEGPDDFSADEWESQDRQKHRWLPRRAKTDHVLDNTPISKTTYDASGPGWFRWQVGAQEHYSLLEHLENNEMWRYRYHLWDFQYLRVGIQCIAIMGSDINAAKPISPDDEQHFAVTMPEKLGRRKQPLFPFFISGALMTLVPRFPPTIVDTEADSTASQTPSPMAGESSPTLASALSRRRARG